MYLIIDSKGNYFQLLELTEQDKVDYLGNGCSIISRRKIDGVFLEWNPIKDEWTEVDGGPDSDDKPSNPMKSSPQSKEDFDAWTAQTIQYQKIIKLQRLIIQHILAADADDEIVNLLRQKPR